MKEQKKSFRQRTEDFLSGRGFYIALSACVLVIAISAWTLLTTGTLADRTNVTDSTATAGILEKDSIRDSITVPSVDKNVNTDTPQASKSNTTDTDTATDTVSESNTSNTINTDTILQAEISEDNIENTLSPIEDESAVSVPLSFAWPVFGSIDVGYFNDELVYNKTMMDWRTHSAVDITADLGAKVMAVAEGTVTDIYEDALLGTVVVIDHGDGLESIYANLASTPAVNIGDTVNSTSVIGAVGDTAIGETGQPYHLHFSMKKDGESVDPTDYLP